MTHAKLSVKTAELNPDIRWIEDEALQTVCDFYFVGLDGNPQPHPDAEDHAARIVTAINSHDGMLEALEKAGEYFEQRADIDGDNEKDGDGEMSLLVEIEAAIKAARED